MKDKADNIFNPDTAIEPVEWLVKPIIPRSALSALLGQSHTGKSFFVEALVTAIAYGNDFLGLPIVNGNVLLIDQDTPSDALDQRLAKFAKYYPEHKFNIYRHSMEDLYLENGTLAALINSYKDIVLCGVDCLHGVCDKVDPDKTRDMLTLRKFHSSIDRKGLTTLLLHHISDKKDSSPEYLMTCQPRQLSMGSSAVTQVVDGYYVLASPDTTGILQTLYVRPVSKRITIPMKPMIVRLIDNATSHFEYVTNVEATRASLTEDEKVVFDLYETVGVTLTVNQVFAQTTGTFGIQTARDVLKSLKKKKFLSLKKTQHNTYHYERIK